MERVPLALYLIAKGASPHHLDSFGCTLLHWAAYKNSLFLFKILENIGLDPVALDNYRLTPLQRAVKNAAFDVARYLIEEQGQELPVEFVRECPWRNVKRMCVL